MPNLGLGPGTAIPPPRVRILGAAASKAGKRHTFRQSSTSPRAPTFLLAGPSTRPHVAKAQIRGSDNLPRAVLSGKQPPRQKASPFLLSALDCEALRPPEPRHREAPVRYGGEAPGHPGNGDPTGPDPASEKGAQRAHPTNGPKKRQPT